MIKVAYIIVCWNNKSLLRDCIDSINNQDYSAKEIYLIDNFSNDGSAEFVKKNFPNIHLLESKKNNGFAKGNNILIERALKDEEIRYFALINTDARLSKDWTRHLVDTAERKPLAALLQGLTLDFYDHGIVDSHHIYINTNLQATQYGYQKSNTLSSLATCEVMGVNAAAALVARSFVEKQPKRKLFDDSFFMYLEDVDLSLRALNQGWHNYFVKGAIAYHMGSASSKTISSSFSLYYTARNQLGLLVKNFPLKVLIKSIPNFLKHEYQFLIYLKGNYSNKILAKYIEGRIVGLFRMILYLPKRHTLQKQTQLRSSFLWALMSNKGWIE